MAIAVEEAASGKTILWGAPTYDQVRVGWNETKKAALGAAKFNQSVMVAQFPSGGAIHYRSLDNPDNARGRTADGIVIDESADVADTAWSEVLRPMLMDTGGWLWAIGTPKGQNWFWREFVGAVDRKDSMSWNAPTLGCEIRDGRLVRAPHPLENPDVKFSELQQMFGSMPERVFRQEILAEFIEDSGGVFRGVSACVDKDRTTPDPPNRADSYFMGIDLARVADFTVLAVLDQRGRQVYHERFNQISWDRQCETIKRVATLYGNARIHLDSTGVGDPIFERLRKAGLHVAPYVFTNTSKEALIDNLAMMIEGGRVSLMDVPVQTTELQAYQYELTPSRNVRMNAPEGLHDDCVISLALAAWGQSRPRSSGSASVGGTLPPIAQSPFGPRR